MSTTSPRTSSSLKKRTAYTLVSLTLAALILMLPQLQHAMPPGAHPSQSAAQLLRPALRLLPGRNDFWHTEGSRILDANNRAVRISGMNWSGFETKEAVLGGLEVQDYRAILRTIKQNGYNTVRIPFSNEMVEMPVVPDRVRFGNEQGAINTDLRDLTSIEILDKVVAYSGKIGLKIILDNHRSEAGSSAQESGLWYTAQFPESAWVNDWTALAQRYAGDATVIGMDLRNEPHNADKGGACWDCGGPNDWHRAAQRAGDAILGVNPRLLIFVEGVDTYAGDIYWWGGNLEGVRRSPVRLAVANRLVYSAHEYGPAEYQQPWFNAGTTPMSLAAMWRKHWAYISEAGIAPVWIGEFGTLNNDADVASTMPGSEGQWFGSLVTFLSAHRDVGWTYWGVNGEDRYGLLDRAYSSQPANSLKGEALARIESSSGTRPETFSASERTPSAESSSFSAVRYQAPLVTEPQSSGFVVNAEGYAAPERPVQIPQVSKAAPITSNKKRLSPGSADEMSVQHAMALNVRKATSAATQSLAASGAVSQ